MSGKRPFTPAEVARIRAMREQGHYPTAIARALGRSVASVKSKIDVMERHPEAPTSEPKPRPKPAAPAQPLPVAEFKAAAEASRKPVITSALTDAGLDLAEVQDPARMWAAAEAEAELRIKKAQLEQFFRADFTAFDEPIAVAALSDQHFAPGTPVDFKAARRDAELIRDTPNLWAVLAGDGIDNHIKHRAAVLAARSQPGDQYILFDYYLEIFWQKILSLVTGNHEFWTVQIAGVDMIARLAKARKIQYAPHEARITIALPGVEYEWMVRHQARFNSSFNQTHSVKQQYSFGLAPFDVGVVAHHHEHACESFVRHGKIRWAIRPGSYQITSAYSRQNGYADSIPTSPTIVMFPHQRRMVGFPTVQDAVDAMRGFCR